jgi:hypothetical protein
MQKVLEAVNKANVQYETVARQLFRPYEEIIDVVKKCNCDVIFMAFHRRKGLI